MSLFKKFTRQKTTHEINYKKIMKSKFAKRESLKNNEFGLSYIYYQMLPVEVTDTVPFDKLREIIYSRKIYKIFSKDYIKGKELERLMNLLLIKLADTEAPYYFVKSFLLNTYLINIYELKMCKVLLDGKHTTLNTLLFYAAIDKDKLATIRVFSYNKNLAESENKKED